MANNELLVPSIGDNTTNIAEVKHLLAVNYCPKLPFLGVLGIEAVVRTCLRPATLLKRNPNTVVFL